MPEGVLPKMSVKDIPNYSNDLPFIENILSACAKPVSWILVHTPASGAFITLVSMLFALAGGALMLFRGYSYSIMGLACWIMFIFLDHVDGQVARYKGQSGKAGEYLDSRAHHIVEPVFFICLGIGSFIRIFVDGGLIYLSVLFLSAGILSAVFYLMRQTMKVEGLGETKIRSMKSERGLLGKLNYIVFEFIRINQPLSLMSFAIIFSYLGNTVGYALCVYAVLFFINLVISFFRTYSSLKKEN